MKFSGKIGYCYSEEGTGEKIGTWEDVTVERPYYGDVLSAARRLEQGADILDNVNISNRISIMADAFLYEHFAHMRWIEWMGSKWKIKTAEIKRPRLILEIGGVYNGPES